MAAAANRYGIKIDKGYSFSFTVEMVVTASGTASIAAGTPTKMSSATAVAMVDGNGTTSESFTGIAKDTSTETASVNGVVQLWAPVPGMTYRAGALVSTAATTQAKIDALAYKRVVFDLTSSVWTVDSAAADAVTKCVVIVGGNPLTNELSFIYATSGTVWGNPTTQLLVSLLVIISNNIFSLVVPFPQGNDREDGQAV